MDWLKGCKRTQKEYILKNEKIEMQVFPGPEGVNQMTLLLNVLVLLPFDSLCRLSLVCKAWFNLINSSIFREARYQKSTAAIFSLKQLDQEKVDRLSLQSVLGLLQKIFRFLPSLSEPYRCCFYFLQLPDGKSKTCYVNNPSDHIGFILATCNGLVLVTTENQRTLMLMDPITGKRVRLPGGTIRFDDQSYGIMSKNYTSGYKIVHLFREREGDVSCEILSLKTRSWRAVEGPSQFLFNSLSLPISISGALYWLPSESECTCLVYMSFDEEGFLTKSLPTRSALHDRLIEIDGFLSFVTHSSSHEIEMWILNCSELLEEWVKLCSIITSHCIRDLIPVCVSSDNEQIFFRQNKVHNEIQACNLVREEMQVIKVAPEKACRWYLPYYLPCL